MPPELGRNVDAAAPILKLDIVSSGNQVIDQIRLDRRPKDVGSNAGSVD